MTTTRRDYHVTGGREPGVQYGDIFTGSAITGPRYPPLRDYDRRATPVDLSVWYHARSPHSTFELIQYEDAR